MQCLLGRQPELQWEIWSKWFFKRPFCFFGNSPLTACYFCFLCQAQKNRKHKINSAGGGEGELVETQAVLRSRVWSRFCNKRWLWTWPGSPALSIFGHTEKFFCMCGVWDSLPRTWLFLFVCFKCLLCVQGRGVSGGWEDWDMDIVTALQCISYGTSIKYLKNLWRLFFHLWEH